MTELERINKVISDLYDIRDVALSVFGDEGYFALDDSIRSLTKTWNICKKGQEERLKNTYHTPVNSSKKPIKSSADNLPSEVYYMVAQGAKMYYSTDYDKVADMVQKINSEPGPRVYGPYTEDDPEEIQELYEVGYLSNSRKPIKSDYHNKEIYREAFASLVKDSDAQDFDNGDYGIAHYPGFYRVLVDGNYETEFSAETDEEAIQKFKDYFANKKKGINNSKKSIKSSFVEDLNNDEGLDYFTVPELQRMNYEKLKNGEITDDEYLENDELIIKYKGKINSSKKSIKSTVNDDAYDEYYDDGIWDDNNWKEELRRRYNENSTEWPSEEYNYCKDTFLDDFSKEYNIPREQVDIEMRLMEDRWLEDADKAGIVDEYSVYSSKTRNQSSLNKIFS